MRFGGREASLEIRAGAEAGLAAMRELLDRASTDDLEEAFVRIIGG